MTEQPPPYDPNAQPPQPPTPPPPPAYGAPPPPPPAYGQVPPPYGQVPPPYGQVPPAYGQPVPGYYPQAAQTSGKATTSLVLGIVGCLFCPLIASIAAIFVGLSAKKDIKAAQGNLGGDGQATAGIVLGAIGIVLTIGIAVLIGIGISTANCVSTNTGNTYNVNCT